MRSVSCFVCTVRVYVCTYVGPYIAACTDGSACHLYRAPLLSPRVPSPWLSQVCPTVRTHMSKKGWPLGHGTKALPHCTVYAMLPCSGSTHNVLHPPSINRVLVIHGFLYSQLYSTISVQNRLVTAAYYNLLG